MMEMLRLGLHLQGCGLQDADGVALLRIEVQWLVESRKLELAYISVVLGSW